MRPNLQRFVPNAQCFRSAPAAPAAPVDPLGPEPVQSLARQLLDREPTWKEKIKASPVSGKLCISQEGRLRSKALVRSQLKFFNSDGPGGPHTTKTDKAPELLHSLCSQATSAAGKEELKRQIHQLLGQQPFVNAFGTIAADAVYGEHSTQTSAGLRAAQNVDRGLFLLAKDTNLGPAIDQAYAEYIAARVAAKLDKDAPAPAAIQGGASRLVEVRVRVQVAAATAATAAANAAATEKRDAQKLERAILNHPLVSILGLREKIGDAVLTGLSKERYTPDRVATLFTELIAFGTTEADKLDLKKALAHCFESALNSSYLCEWMEAFSRLACCPSPAGRENKQVAWAADMLANLPGISPALERIFAPSIARRVAQLSRDGVGSSDKVVAVLPGGVSLLVEAKARAYIKREEATARDKEVQRKLEVTIENHPIQKVLDVRSMVCDDASWKRPLVTSYGVPCERQVAELVRELSQAATSAKDQKDLKNVVAHLFNSRNPWGASVMTEFVDVAHQQNRMVDQTAKLVIQNNPGMGGLLDSLYGAQIAQYVEAHAAAAGAGSVPSEVPGVVPRVQLLVKARADMKLKAMKEKAWQKLNAGAHMRLSQNAEYLVDAREAMSAELRTKDISHERRAYLTEELDGHEVFKSTQERDQVLKALSISSLDARSHKVLKALGTWPSDARSRDREPGEQFLNGWPLSDNAAKALDQVILYERTRKHVADTASTHTETIELL
jgi:hypothetical protein